MNRAFLPKDLIYRVSRYYDYIWMNQKQGMGSNSAGVLHDADLSMPLRKEIALQLHGPLLAQLSLFHGCSADCLFAVAMKLRTHMYLPNDLIFLKGDFARELYFIRKGIINVFLEVGAKRQDETKKRGSMVDSFKEFDFNAETPSGVEVKLMGAGSFLESSPCLLICRDRALLGQGQCPS